MNYLKTYCSLMRKAQNRNLTTQYIEKHHIFPISIFGKNKNLVKLTYREHFLAHKLLAKIYEKRYGLFDNKTCKMNMAIHRMVYTYFNTYLTSRDYDLARKAVRNAKLHKRREDMIGKKYFGASEENIKKGIKKMIKSKTGSHFTYKQPRGPLPHTKEWGNNISKGRQLTIQRYIDMTDEEFNIWRNAQQKFRYQHNSNKKCVNPNITRAMIARKIPICEYYDVSDYNDGWIKRKGNKEKFYGL